VGEHEKAALYLLGVGAALAVGKLLASDEVLSLRLVVGRALVGAIMSLPAGLILLTVPDIHPLALVALGAGIGIAGEQALEKWLCAKMGVNK